MTVGAGVVEDVFEDAVAVDVDEVGAVEGVELVDEVDDLGVEDSNGTVDLLDAGDAVGAVLGELVGGAPHLADADQHYLPGPVVVQSLESDTRESM